MSEARSRMAYGRAAVNFDVNESDFLVLLDDRVDTFESMAYRFPSSTDFEDYLKKTVRNKGAYRDSSGAIQVYTKAQGTPWDVFKSAEDTGCLRKLWSLAHQVSKKELETLASPGEETRQKVTLTMSQEWEERAISEGMPIALSDRERPGLICLGKVQAAYMTGGSFEYLNFECYMDAETEGRLKRAGRLPKDKQELVYSNDRITVKSKTDEMPKMEIIDAADMREILEIRARAFHMAKVCDFETCRQLTERYLSKLRATQVEGMRGPTINEVRRTDREIFQTILVWVAKGQGSVSAGIRHYLDNPAEALWKLLDSSGYDARPRRREAVLEPGQRLAQPCGALQHPSGNPG